ncbi:MAG TPA: HypC/HybG/HupF family hydrogenase formation chaperone [Roseiflexaceae bacterium]|nr:HypC/HybG/HupF family hydrogenase formation chaperone [Roseiflexaceae bacterium]
MSPDLRISTFPACEPDTYGHCVTCSDEAQQVRVLSVDDATGFAMAEVNGVTGEVDISLVDDLAPGDFILIHGGVAIAKL